MAIPFTCPHCGLVTQVAEKYAGQQGPCAGCGKPVSIPDAPQHAQQQRGQKQTAANTGSRFTLILAAAILLAAISTMTALIVVAVRVVPPKLKSTQVAVQQQISRENLRILARAFRRYHERHGTFPPAFIADESGKPQHSWRVLLLPFLGEERLHAQYNFDQPWDSPENQALANRMPDVYGSPDDPDASFSETSYLVVVGEGAAFKGTERSSLSELTDGPDKTILLVESMGHGINWMEPRDLRFGTIPMAINSDRKESINRTRRVGGAHVVMADGNVYRLADATPPEAVRAMLTAQGGESVMPSDHAVSE